MEAIQQVGPNVVGFQLAAWKRRWYIIGCYLAPDNTLTIDCVFAALKERPQGSELLVAGDFNTNLDQPEGDRREKEIAAAWLEDMSAQFLT